MRRNLKIGHNIQIQFVYSKDIVWQELIQTRDTTNQYMATLLMNININSTGN